MLSLLEVVGGKDAVYCMGGSWMHNLENSVVDEL